MGRAFYLLKCGDKSLDVVAVIDIQVVQAHRFEEVILGSTVGAAQLSELVVHAAMVLGDGHLVVVEDDDKVAVQLTGNVQALKRLAAGHGSVADNGDDVLPAAHNVASLCQTKRQADGRGSVADFEEVMRGSRRDQCKETPSRRGAGSMYACLRPVSILWGYVWCETS